jgi:NAD(P)-dependent dehydrogenase (short-subunit alcohol dehydrogenase family)
MIDFSKSDRFLVTGASSGIGQATALLLNRLGATVIVNGRNSARLAALKTESSEPDRILLAPRDLTDDMAILDRWIQGVVENFGELRGLAHCAGIRQIIPLKAMSLGRTQKIYEINIFSAGMLAKGLAASRANLGKDSSIVFVSSQSTLSGAKGLIDYTGTKGAILAITRSLALELADQGIRVNCVLPGLVATEMLKSDRALSQEDYLARIVEGYPLGLGEPEDVAGLICFLLSSKARWITGSQWVIDGGASLG